MRRGRVLVVVVVVALVGVLALWVGREGPPDAAVDGPGSADGPASTGSRPRQIQGRAVPALAWLWQRGIAERRIAGRVIHAGRPVAKATVRLATEELRIGEWALDEVETDQEGRFDFGRRPATRYQLVAQAKGLVAGGAVLELRVRDPRPVPDDVTIELRDCELVISGTVRDAAGGIVAGARVRAATRSEFFGTALSDEQGKYQVCLLAGPGHIEASADGYGTAFEHTRGRRTARVDFALSPEVAIAGRVVDPAGKPVGGAVVIAETNGHDPGALTESRSDGGFRIEGLIEGKYRVVARDGDRAADKTVAITAAGAAAELVLTLEPRAALAGRVVVGGKPAGDAKVIVHSVEEDWTLGSAVARSDGRFAIAGLPRGPVKLEVEKLELLSPDATVDLAAVSDVELVCQRLATVSGRVVRAGKPVARADVHLYHEKRSHAARSEDDGSFEIEGVAAASYHITAASLAEGASMARRAMAVGAQGVAGLVLELDLTASIAGAVVDAKGAPVAGVTVSFQREDEETGEEASDTTADDGTFLVGGLAAGSYRPHVFRSRGGWADYRPAGGGRRHPIVKVADGASRVTGVQLAVSRGEMTISGRAVRRGEAVAGVDIAASSEADFNEVRGQSEADGTFVLEGLAAGPYRLHAPRIGGQPIRVDAGARDVVLELPASGRIDGVLRGFRTRPEVSVRGPDADRQADVTDMGFAIAEIAVGTYDVSAIASDGAFATASVTVTAEQVSRPTLTAGATGTLAGVVKELKTGAPMAGVHCYWMIGENTGASMRPFTTDETGRFSVGVASGAIRVECFGGDDTPVVAARRVAVDVKPGATAQVVVEVIPVRGGQPSGMIGVQLEPVPSGSLRIASLHGAAASSGLRVGDMLLAVDGLPVAGLQPHAVYVLMTDRKVGETAKLTVEREGAELAFEVVVEPMPMQPEDE